MADHNDHSNDTYIHGEMDIHQHQASYELFGNFTKWGSLAIAVFLCFVVILTCVKGAGWLPALITAVVVATLGYLLLKPKPDAGH